MMSVSTHEYLQCSIAGRNVIDYCSMWTRDILMPGDYIVMIDNIRFRVKVTFEDGGYTCDYVKHV